MQTGTRKPCDAKNNLQNTVQIPVQYLVQSFCAARRADARAVFRAEGGAVIGAEWISAPAGRPVYRGQGLFIPRRSRGATCRAVEQVAPLELENLWLLVSYKQVAPLELKRRAVFRADDDAEHGADEYAEPRAVVRADVLQKMAAMQNNLQKKCRKRNCNCTDIVQNQTLRNADMTD